MRDTELRCRCRCIFDRAAGDGYNRRSVTRLKSRYLHPTRKSGPDDPYPNPIFHIPKLIQIREETRIEMNMRGKPSGEKKLPANYAKGRE
jgi:hypothetical protein